MHKRFSLVTLSLLTVVGSAFGNCADWELRGTFFQPDKAALADWVPKEVFDRIVVSVDKVDEQDGVFEATLTLDRKLPQTSGKAKAVVAGEAVCFSAFKGGDVPTLELGKKVRLLWRTDPRKKFQAQQVVGQLLMVSLDKRID